MSRIEAAALPRPRWRYLALGLGLGAAVLAATVLGLDVSGARLLAELRALPLAALVVAAAGAVGMLALQALRWWVVMRPVVDLRYREAYAALAIGYLFNTFLPARGGEVVRVIYLGRRTGVSSAKIFGTEVVDFFSDKWGWVAAFPLLCLTGNPPPWLWRALGLLGFAVVGTGATLALMASGRFRARQPTWLRNLREGFAANHWKRLLLVETVIAPMPWLFETTIIVIAARLSGIVLEPIQAFGVLTAFNVAMLVVPAPGNVGSVEAGGLLALVFFGVPKESALAFLCAYHLCQVLPSAALGAVALLAELTLRPPRPLPSPRSRTSSSAS